MKNLFLKIWFFGKVYFYITFQVIAYFGATIGISFFLFPQSFINNVGGAWGRVFVVSFLMLLVFYPLIVFEGTKKFYRDQISLYEFYKN